MRKIIHVDLDAFFCAVEELRNPALKGQLFAVGGMPDQRGVVASCSYPARRCGVHSAMPMAQARQLCPGLIIIRADHHSYSAASSRVMEIFGRLTPLVEQISIDEAFLDVSDLPQTGIELARNLQANVNQETGLPCSLGIATNKLVAKIATDTAKKRHQGDGYPNAILEAPAGEEARFLSALPVSALWGVGPKTEAVLEGIGIMTIGQLAAAPEKQMMERFGKNGFDLVRHARGIDERAVETSHEMKSISSENTFDRDIDDRDTLLREIHTLSVDVARRLRANDLAGNTVRLKLRWPDFTTLSRQVRLPQPSDQDSQIFGSASELFYKVWQPSRAVRLLGVGVSGLEQGPRQLSLFEASDGKEKRLLEAIDEIHQKFGSKSVQLGYNLKSSTNKRKG